MIARFQQSDRRSQTEHVGLDTLSTAAEYLISGTHTAAISTTTTAIASAAFTITATAGSISETAMLSVERFQPSALRSQRKHVGLDALSTAAEYLISGTHTAAISTTTTAIASAAFTITATAGSISEAAMLSVERFQQSALRSQRKHVGLDALSTAAGA